MLHAFLFHSFPSALSCVFTLLPRGEPGSPASLSPASPRKSEPQIGPPTFENGITYLFFIIPQTFQKAIPFRLFSISFSPRDRSGDSERSHPPGRSGRSRGQNTLSHFVGREHRIFLRRLSAIFEMEEQVMCWSNSNWCGCGCNRWDCGCGCTGNGSGNSSGSDPTWRCRWVCTSNWSTNSTALTDAASDLATTDSLPFGADFFTGDSGCGCSG